MSAQLTAWHRRCGLLACVALFVFALSGMMHPVMSRLQPQPVERAAPTATLAPQAQPPAAVLRQHAVTEFTGLRLVQAGAHSAYRVALPDGTSHYFRSSDGQQLADGERLHAETLARHASGDHQSDVRELVRIDAFDQDYPAINRLLPVWRVRFDRDDGLTAYVDTRGDRLATLQDHPKRVAQTLFRQLHNVAALEALPWLRVPLMLTLLAAALIAVVTGLLGFWREWRRSRSRRRSGNQPRRPLTARDQHRYLALGIAITTLGFLASGGWHLLHGVRQPAPPAPSPSRFVTSELGDALPPAPFQLVRVDGTPCYRTPERGAPAGPHHHHGAAPAAPEPVLACCVDTATGEPLPAAERRLAIALARYHAGNSTAPVTAARPVLQFDDDYGFANKRLPVWQVRFGDDPTRWYVETSSGALALRADGASAAEGWAFSHLHKWQFIAQPDLRDALLMLCAALQLGVATLGLRLFLRRRARIAGANGTLQQRSADQLPG
ncbi:MAG: PepSY domain-containing protein [Spongiibacteraceae bacterium]|nr:PepSY domain-containing protein [Spongiibacteraceae bacterium]